MVAVDEAYETSSVQSSIEALLRERRNITRGEQDNFNIFDTRQISETLQGTTRILTAVMGAVAAVSLIVGGIGIMNIMLVSVTERTREIGIRMAIGARGSDVLTQFLVESVVISVLGGIIGIGVGLLGAMLVSTFTGFTAVTPLAAVLIAVGFSAAIGIFFGFYPARQAAAMNPIQALRYE